MKKVESWEILVSLSANEISLAEAHDQLLRLFNVAGRTEQLSRQSSYEPCDGCDLSCEHWMPFFCDKK